MQQNRGLEGNKTAATFTLEQSEAKLCTIVIVSHGLVEEEDGHPSHDGDVADERLEDDSQRSSELQHFNTRHNQPLRLQYITSE